MFSKIPKILILYKLKGYEDSDVYKDVNIVKT